MPKEVDPRGLARSPYQLLKRASQYAASIYMDKVGRTGLTQRQYAVLMAAESSEGASQAELGRLTGIDRSTLADLVGRLMAQGYLQSRRGRDDGRTHAVKLTGAGRRALRAAEPGAGDADRELIAAIPARYRKGFIEGLASLASHLEPDEPPPRKARKVVRAKAAKAPKTAPPRSPAARRRGAQSATD
jgi:DNA-binding MarR family transcriptional regulator